MLNVEAVRPNGSAATLIEPARAISELKKNLAPIDLLALETAIQGF